MKDTDIKATGMTRKVDPLGRISLPVELRRNMGISVGDYMEFSVSDSSIIIKKYIDPDACVFCGRSEEDSDTEVFRGKKICHTCLGDFREKVPDGQL